MLRPLAAAALLCALSSAPLHAAQPRKPRPPTKDMITVDKIEPKSVHPGDRVTVTGEHLDAIAAVLLGKMSPKIVEHTPKTLVFLAPSDVGSKVFQAYVFLLIPGQPLMQTRTQISVVPATDDLGSGAGAQTTLSEDGTLTAGNPKSWPVAIDGVTAFEVAVKTTGGEAEARLEAEGAEPLVRATYAGTLRWRVMSRELGSPGSVKLTLTADAAHVGYHAVVTRLGSGTKRTPVPKPRAATLK